MNKAILAGLTLMLVRDCELVGSRPAGGTIKGTWGGDNAGLIADDSSAHVHIRCTFGNVHQAIVLNAAGRFDVPGDYVLRAYPGYVGLSLPARFQGSVSGKTMALSVTVQDTTADPTAQLGPVLLCDGQEPRMGPCPICRRPGRSSRRSPLFISP